MVIDNTDDMELSFPYQLEEGSLKTTTAEKRTDCGLGRYIPECRHGSVIITTRSKMVGSRLAQGKLPIEVGSMDDNEAHSLLYTCLENEKISADETSLLSSKLEHLPLALMHATAFIQENRVPLHKYIQLLDESDSAFVDRLSEPFETVERNSKTPRALTATWIISFNQTQQVKPLESDILSFIGLFHWQAIPREFIEDYCSHGQPEDADPSKPSTLTKTLGTLKAFSFILEDKDRNINMHRLVQLVTRKWLDIKRKNFAQLALKTVSDAYPFGQFETHDKCLRSLPHAYAVLEQNADSEKDERVTRAKLLHCMGGYFNYRGQWDLAGRYQIEAARIFREEKGEGHASMGSLAIILSNQGRWEEAEKLEVRVMETRKTKLGASHPSTLMTINNFAFTWMSNGKGTEAIDLMQTCIHLREAKLGVDHPHTRSSDPTSGCQADDLIT